MTGWDWIFDYDHYDPGYPSVVPETQHTGLSDVARTPIIEAARA